MGFVVLSSSGKCNFKNQCIQEYAHTYSACIFTSISPPGWAVYPNIYERLGENVGFEENYTSLDIERVDPP